ncbi:competence protein CoiA family protein [Bacillus sp. UNCCL81]|uniref:competence protein CoiA n=1 Tax=Bacillus sp. UNCCL81 TaxID=1502755 RepID=UPI0008E43E6D|nr:competence protein CoiA family protein [Bacillus sp. UNCCL81]SFC52698.1 competence protein CoiA [Bacillus sp. UNCCL81]
MLRCINANKDTFIASTCVEESIRKLSRERGLFCPNCENNVVFKKGEKVRAHFAHYKSDCVVTNYESETYSHIKGKEILFNWLIKNFPTAEIEYEVYIAETRQIADIYVEHTEAELKGIRWAIEFQHSPLSSKEWKQRHELYQSAGIQDFWILDKAKYMKFSTAKGIENARLRKDLETEIFKETGLCYFLDLEHSEITIDFEFTSSYERRIVNRLEVKTEYIYHNPIKHSCHINKVNIKVNKEFLYGVFVCNELEDRMKSKLSSILHTLKRKEQKRLEEELKIRAIEKRKFAEEKYGEDLTNIIWEFMRENKEELAEDIRNLRNHEFFDKYDKLIKNLFSLLSEFKSWKEENDLLNKFLTTINYETDFYKLNFLVEQNSSTLQKYLIDKDRKKFELVEYVYKKHRDVLEKLTTYRTKYVYKKLEGIKSSLKPWEDNPSVIDYALRYRYLKSKEEIDECIEQINSKIIIKKPTSLVLDPMDLE